MENHIRESLIADLRRASEIKVKYSANSGRMVCTITCILDSRHDRPAETSNVVLNVQDGTLGGTRTF